MPEEFNDFVIAHVSDLHNKQFGKNQKDILTKLKNIAPNAIVITGDLIDRRKYDLDTAMTFVEGAVDIAPVFCVSGNHEAWSGKYSAIEKELRDAGAHVLDNSIVKLSIEDSSLLLFGVNDPVDPILVYYHEMKVHKCSQIEMKVHKCRIIEEKVHKCRHVDIKNI